MQQALSGLASDPLRYCHHRTTTTTKPQRPEESRFVKSYTLTLDESLAIAEGLLL